MSSATNPAASVGRLVLARLPGLALDSAAKAALQSGIIGGVVLFKENFQDLAQSARFVTDIIENSLHVPIIAVDQEGGPVQRLDHVLTPLPSPMALAATGDTKLIEQVARINASQLRQLGFNYVLTPVLDVFSESHNPTNPTRTFGDDPKTVAACAKAYNRGIKAENMVGVGKHFPGHGATLQDSHESLAVITSDETKFRALDLNPFADSVNELDSIMVGHIWVKALEEKPTAASFSKKLVQDVLIKELNFDRLIVTDDLTMQGAKFAGGLGEAAVQALLAGIDLLMVASDIKSTLSAVDHLQKAVEEGTISRKRIATATAKIDKLFGKHPHIPSEDDLEALAQDIREKKQLALAASIAGIALLRGKKIELGKKVLVLAPKHPRYALPFADYLKNAGGKEIEELRYELDPSEKQCQQIADKVKDQTIILLTYRSWQNKGQTKLAETLKNKAKALTAVAVEGPYDCESNPAPDNYLATFDPSDLAMEALAEVFIKNTELKGKCPVKLRQAQQTV